MTAYYIHPTDDRRIGIAYGQDGEQRSSFPDHRLDDWATPVLRLREGTLADYQPNDMGYRLCNARLRGMLAEYETQAVQWLEAIVMDGSRRHRYYALHFTRPSAGVLHADTIYSYGEVLKAVLKRDAVSDRSVFALPANRGVTWIVGGTVKAAIEAAGAAGMAFSGVAER